MLLLLAVPMPTKSSIRSANPSITDFIVDGMTCNNCARHVTEAIQSLPEVASVGVSLEGGTATIKWKSQTAIDVGAVLNALKNAGYPAKVVDESSSDPRNRSIFAGWRFNAIVGSTITAILMLGEWGFHWTGPSYRWIAFLLASVVQILCGAKFYKGAWAQLKTGSSNMDTLVSLGSSTAYLFSVWALLSGSGAHLYFVEAAGIITFVSVGHWLEARVSRQASSALRNLLNLQPQKARRRDANGVEIEVPVSELRVDDLVVLRPGDKVPSDGETVSGDSTINESMLTGEALPVTKRKGSKVFTGTVNLDGQILVRVTATGDDTALSHIVAAVERAQSSRAAIQRLGDRVSNVFVPIVIVLAIATAIWWSVFFDQAQAVNSALFGSFHFHHAPQTPAAAAFIYAAAVLIVACPCAMGLATPIAIMAGTNAAASLGILIRDGIALEKAGQISTVVFDKTGTITVGAPRVVAHEVSSDNPLSPRAIEIAAAVARGSNHPLSRALAQLSDSRFGIDAWQEIRGSGLLATVAVDGTNFPVRLGALPWLSKTATPQTNAAFVEKWTEQGATVLGLAVDGKVLALFALQDELKPDVASVINELARKDLKVFLVTGDNQKTARSLAAQVGIPLENVAAEVRPENKAQFVKDMQARGHRVAFVGDGINDAPALEQADLGIAVAKASDIASEAADIILLNSDVHAIPETLGLAGATLRTVKQNLFWAFFYNAASIPLAALGFLSPILCAAAMGFSDLIVIGNALRLRRWKLPHRRTK